MSYHTELCETSTIFGKLQILGISEYDRDMSIHH